MASLPAVPGGGPPSGSSGLRQHGGPQQVHAGPAFVRQCCALLRKNLLVRARSWRLNLLYVLQSLLIILLVFGIDKALIASNSLYGGKRPARNPPASVVSSIPDCRRNIFITQRPCYSFAYSPAGVPWVEQLVTQMRLNNKPPIPPELVRGFDTMEQVGSKDGDMHHQRCNPIC